VSSFRLPGVWLASKYNVDVAASTVSWRLYVRLPLQMIRLAWGNIRKTLVPVAYPGSDREDSDRSTAPTPRSVRVVFQRHQVHLVAFVPSPLRSETERPFAARHPPAAQTVRKHPRKIGPSALLPLCGVKSVWRMHHDKC
jgi:hypothetical protein